MSGHSYVHPSRVELRETNGHRPTREQLLHEQQLEERRRERAAQARAHIEGEPHAR